MITGINRHTTAAFAKGVPANFEAIGGRWISRAGTKPAITSTGSWTAPVYNRKRFEFIVLGPTA